MRRLIVTLLVLILLIAGCGGSDDDSAEQLENPNETASELINQYAELSRDKDQDGLDDFISEAFIIQRADGSFRLKDDYLDNLPDLQGYEITDIVAVQDGDVLTVRWFISVDQQVDGVQTSTEPAPRLSTFIYQDGKWRLASHANFNAPTEE